MNPADLNASTEHSDSIQQWISKIREAMEKAVSLSNICEDCETAFCLVAADFSKFLALDLPKEESKFDEASVVIRESRLLFTKTYKLIKSMRFMRLKATTDMEFISTLLNFRTVTASQMHEALAITEMFVRTVWLFGETVSSVRKTISEFENKKEEMNKYPTIGSNEE
ncbi:uncharacterized protein TNCT_36581 [Trichonephila clavata]|uniref:PH domain-containing protein n=1 Tax=Trichonephila clavata TaxID=2740835 RepID=A0A8X6KVH3_TRICU|nr:uncharacterized protein TNCT_36581 [Trichonephila clavata]